MSTKAKIFIVGTLNPTSGWWFCCDFTGGLDMDHGYTQNELQAIVDRYGTSYCFRPPVAIDNIQEMPVTLRNSPVFAPLWGDYGIKASDVMARVDEINAQADCCSPNIHIQMEECGLVEPGRPGKTISTMKLE